MRIPSVTKIYSYLEDAKTRAARLAAKKADEVASQESAQEVQKLFDKSVKRAQEIIDLKSDPQHLINFLV